ncbi:MAG TPA: hypothetical protein VMM18_17555 [Gemmatimonadaceae bacterium]|nr:hypothetical protein [Gemmatimonadaceae bacterium]
MKARRIERNGGGSLPKPGMILCAEVRDDSGRAVLRKGQVLGAEDVILLDRLDWRELHVIEPAAGELHEEEAGRRLAAAAAGDGVTVQDFAGGHWGLASTRRGMLAVAVDALNRANRVEGACLYTFYDGQIVDVGDIVGRAKVTPFVLAEERVREVEALAREARGLVRVAPFRRARVGAVVQERVNEQALSRFRGALEEKLAWLGSDIVDVRAVAAEAGAVAAAVRALIDSGADVVVFAGTRAMDPLDPAFVALDELGATLERYGVPAHPGSLSWKATLAGVPLIGMPTCGLFAQATSFDLILPRLLAGRPVDHASLAELGHGGMLTKEMSFRFPPYRAAAGRGAVE